MKNLLKKVFLICVIVFGMDYLCKHTITMRYVIPINYYIDLSMVVVLLCVGYLKDRRLGYAVFVLKELLSLRVAMLHSMNGWAWIMQFGTAGLDLGLIILVYIAKGVDDEPTINAKELLKIAAFYVIVCVAFNLGCFVRVHAWAYDISLDEFFQIAHYYNHRVNGIWSFLVQCAVPFYIIQVGVYGLGYKMISSLIDGFHVPESE